MVIERSAEDKAETIHAIERGGPRAQRPNLHPKAYDVLVNLLSKDRVFDDLGTRTAYMGSIYFDPNLCIPDFVVVPETVEDVRQTLQIANKYRVPVTPIASGVCEPSCIAYEGGILLDMYSRMNRIWEINYESGYALVEPGVTLGQILAAIREKGYRVSIGSYPAGCSVIGSYTHKSNTTYRTQVIDDVLGIEAVIPDGTVIRTGSAALPNCGWYSQYGPYPGLRELFLSQHGSMGIITKAALRIHKRNEVQACPIAVFDSYEKSHKYSMLLARATMVEHVITYHWSWWKAFEKLMSGKFPRGLQELEHEMGKFAWGGDQTPEGMHFNYVPSIMTGFREVIEAKEKTCKRLARECGGEAFTTKEFHDMADDPIENWWYHDYVEHLPFSPNDPRRYEKGMGRGTGSVPFSMVVFIAPEKCVEYEGAIRKKIYEEFGSHTGYYTHLYDQGRSVFFRVQPTVPYGDPKEIRKARSNLLECYKWAYENFGAVSKRIWLQELNGYYMPKMGGYYEALKRIKREFDPNNILNPGFMMFPGVYK